MDAATDRSRNTGLQLFVRGKLSPPRSTRPKKVTNSEKTMTTKNLSQHKYLLNKRKLQLETQAALDCKSNSNVSNEVTSNSEQSKPPSRLPAVTSRQSSSHACNSRDTYHNCSDWETEWYALYHHFTDYNKECENNTSCVNHSYLTKLLTSIKLAPKAISRNNENHLSGENSHSGGPNDYVSTQDCESKDPFPVNHHSKLSVSTPVVLASGPSESDMGECQPMVCTESFVPTIALDLPFPSQAKEVQQCTGTSRTMISTCSAFNFQVRKPRRQTKSAPSLSYLQPLSETYQQFRSDHSSRYSRPKSLARSHDISKYQLPPSSPTTKEVNFEELKSAKRRQLLLKSVNRPLLDTETPRPQSYWYEMKTPEFHVEAKRNIAFLRKNCNW